MQCGENRHTDIANFATLLHQKKINTLRGNFSQICIEKFARRTWVNFTQQYGKNRQRWQQNTFYYAVWQLLLYFYREFLKNSLRVLSISGKTHFILIQNKTLLLQLITNLIRVPKILFIQCRYSNSLRCCINSVISRTFLLCMKNLKKNKGGKEEGWFSRRLLCVSRVSHATGKERACRIDTSYYYLL